MGGPRDTETEWRERTRRGVHPCGATSFDLSPPSASSAFSVMFVLSCESLFLLLSGARDVTLSLSLSDWGDFPAPGPRPSGFPRLFFPQQGPPSKQRHTGAHTPCSPESLHTDLFAFCTIPAFCVCFCRAFMGALKLCFEESPSVSRLTHARREEKDGQGVVPWAE
eukprot:RCo047003